MQINVGISGIISFIDQAEVIIHAKRNSIVLQLHSECPSSPPNRSSLYQRPPRIPSLSPLFRMLKVGPGYIGLKGSFMTTLTLGLIREGVGIIMTLSTE